MRSEDRKAGRLSDEPREPGDSRMDTPLPAGKLPPWLLQRVLPAGSEDASVLVGPGVGRDAAAILVGDRIVVAKNDPITFATAGGEEHLVEVNANDIACMGGTPRWMMVTGLLPFGITPAEVERNFARLAKACRRRSVELIGGHTEVVFGLERPILVGMMLGEAAPEDFLRPGQARPGHVLLMTKGLAIEGTALLARELRSELEDAIGPEHVAYAAGMIKQPGISIVREAALALAAGGVTALHDPTEGGLATAVRELAMTSDAGVELDEAAIAVLPETREVAGALGLDPLGMLASGSLLIAVRPEAVDRVMDALVAGRVPVAKIGRLTHDPQHFVLRTEGQVRPIPEFAVDEVARILTRAEPPQP